MNDFTLGFSGFVDSVITTFVRVCALELVPGLHLGTVVFLGIVVLVIVSVFKGVLS